MGVEMAGTEARGGCLARRAGTAAAVITLWLVLVAPTAQAALAETIAGPGVGAGRVKSALGTAVDRSSGALYVADRGNLRIDKFDSAGGFLLAWGFGVADNESAELQTCGPQADPPTVRCFHTADTNTDPGAGNIGAEAVAVDQASHDVYVADEGKRRVTKFGPGGEFIFMIGKDVNTSAITPEERSICTLADLEVDGDDCGAGQNGSGVGEFFTSPTAMSVDASGHLWVLDGARIDEFDSAGALLSQVTISAGPPAAKGLERDSTGNFYTVREGRDERQDVSFSGFAKGDTFALGNLPGSCSAAGTGPIVYPGLSNAVEEQELTANLEGALVEQCGEDLAVSIRSISFVKGFAAQNFAPLTCTKLSGAGSCAITTFREGEPGTVEKLDSSGAFIETIHTGGPEALTIDGSGNLYVGDKRDYHFLRFNPAGDLVSAFGTGQVAAGRFGGGPRGNALAVDEANGALYAANSRSGEESAVQRFALPEEGPLPEDPAAEDLEPTTATLTATLNPEGEETSYRFEYLTESAYQEQEESFEGPATEQTPEETLPGTEYEAEAVSAAIEGLIPETAYRFRILATNAAGQTEAEATFTTRPAVVIEAQWSSEVASGSASLHAQLDPLGVTGKWWLELGSSPCSKGGCARLAEGALPASFGSLEVGAALGGLEPSTTYHYRFLASDERDGVKYEVPGAERSFTTQPGALGFTLPDDRVWEMVSPPKKFGATIAVGVHGEGQIQAAAQGDALAYLSAGSIEAASEGNRAPERSSVLSQRNEDGSWSSEDLTPPNAVVGSPSTGRGYEYKLFSPELDSALLEPRTATPLSPWATERTPYLRGNATPPSYVPLLSGAPGFADVPEDTEFGGSLDETVGPAGIQGATPGFDHVALGSSVPLTCYEASPPGTGRWQNSACSKEDKEHEGSWESAQPGALYEWSAAMAPTQRLRAVSVEPGEDGATVKGVLGSNAGSVRGAISADGSRVFWSTVSGGGEPTGLYLRDNAREETLRLDEVQPGAFGTGAEHPVFQGADPAGTVAFFTDTHNLTPDANEEGADLYRCAVVIEAGELACELTDLSANGAESAEVQGLTAGMSEDAGRIYFVARGVLAGESAEHRSPVAGQPNLYLWQQGEGTRFIATLSEQDSYDWGSFGGITAAWKQSAAASPSGRYLAFMSELALTGYDNRDAKSGEAAQEVFRYDAEANGGAGELICASCNPAGARPAGLRGQEGEVQTGAFDPQELWNGRPLAATLPEASKLSLTGASVYHPRAVHDNGRLFFNAADSLVPADANGNWDVYEYEPTGLGSCSASPAGAATARSGAGCLSLISSGTGEEEAAFLDASVGGDDVFFLSPARLSVTDEDSAVDVYDARVGGIAATLEPRAECLGEACQPPASAPEAPTPASAAFRGPRNPSARRQCGPLSRRAGKLSRRARRLRRQSRQMADVPAKRRRARQMQKRAGRLARRAKGIGKRAKRCRRANRRTGR